MIELTNSNYKDYVKDGSSLLFYPEGDESKSQVSKAVASDSYSGGFVVYGKQTFGSASGTRGFSMELLLSKFTVKLVTA